MAVDADDFPKTIFILIISWPITQTAIKISILLFYLQLFVTKQFSIAAYITMSVVCLWCIQQVLAALLICKPISYNWDFHNQTGSCGNTTANCIAGAAVNVLTDLVILLLPMPIIWRLKIPTRSKLSLSFIFGLGFLYVARLVDFVSLNAFPLTRSRSSSIQYLHR